MLTKTQIVTKLAEKVDLPKKQVATLLAEFAALGAKETKTAGAFVVPGFGKLVKVARKARMGRNPQTGAQIKIVAKTVVRFRVAKAMKDQVVPPKAKK